MRRLKLKKGMHFSRLVRNQRHGTEVGKKLSKRLRRKEDKKEDNVEIRDWQS